MSIRADYTLLSPHALRTMLKTQNIHPNDIVSALDVTQAAVIGHMRGGQGIKGHNQEVYRRMLYSDLWERRHGLYNAAEPTILTEHAPPLQTELDLNTAPAGPAVEPTSTNMDFAVYRQVLETWQNRLERITTVYHRLGDMPQGIYDELASTLRDYLEINADLTELHEKEFQILMELLRNDDLAATLSSLTTTDTQTLKVLIEHATLLHES